MGLMDKIRGWFTSGKMPDETRMLIQDADTPDEILQKLDDLLTQNEFKFKELDREITRLEQIETEERRKVQEALVDGRQKRNTLLYIRRLRKEMDLYENRLKIYDRNMNLHINLIAKIQDMQAMDQRGVEEEKIDAIIQDYEENYEKYMNAVIGGEAAFDSIRTISGDDRELKELEREIMGTGKVTEPPVVERPVAERPVIERPVIERPAVEEAAETEEPIAEEPVAEKEPVEKEPEKVRVPITEAMEKKYEMIDREIEQLEKELELE